MGRNWEHQKITLGGLESGLLSTEKGELGGWKFSFFNQVHLRDVTLEI